MCIYKYNESPVEKSALYVISGNMAIYADDKYTQDILMLNHGVKLPEISHV
ncbi:MAG: hypothetical protein IJL23_02395 [Alphaproteobacteria bacterium]|nr:hypothetical protein [Alphaproteobacteria bacterium]